MNSEAFYAGFASLIAYGIYRICGMWGFALICIAVAILGAVFQKLASRF